MKSITLSLRSLITIFLFSTLTMLSAQTIVLDLPTVPLTTCMETSAGTTMTFARGSGCVNNVVVVPGDGVMITQDDVIFTSEDSVFTYTFPSEGQFTLLCDVPGASSVADIVACFDVGPSTAAAIPTLGEWSLIFLVLLALIIGVAVLRKSSTAVVN